MKCSATWFSRTRFTSGATKKKAARLLQNEHRVSRVEQQISALAQRVDNIYRSKTPPCKKAQNLREVASAPGCSCSVTGTTGRKCCSCIRAARSLLRKTMERGKFPKAKMLREKNCLHALILNLKKCSELNHLDIGLSSAR